MLIKAPISLDREALAWAAGFYDGEGTMGFRTINKRWACVRMSIHQVHKDTLERFQNAVGGLGKSIGGPEKSASRLHPGRLPIYRWRAEKFEHVQAVIAFLWPWLTPHKKNQAKEALIKMRTYQESLKCS